MKILTIFADAGHAWGKVSKKELTDLGLADKISSCSYQTKSFVYLEEDCDLFLYCNALKEKGIQYQVLTKYTKGSQRSHIRNYNHYSV